MPNQRFCWKYRVVPDGSIPPIVSGCDPTTSASASNVNTFVPLGQSSVQVTYVPPSAGNVLETTHNNFNNGSIFPLGVTEIIYIFGTPGAQSTCSWYVNVGNSSTRRRRDHALDGCDPFCELTGGMCKIREDDQQPACFWPEEEIKPLREENSDNETKSEHLRRQNMFTIFNIDVLVVLLVLLTTACVLFAIFWFLFKKNCNMPSTNNENIK
ncbi:uncharacterized protein [Amphiura filiformis]|uniref:uncharacterized protein n=1 Tax=Amphiura filiformis TaxID=82378 RepID=UPI003B215A04